MWNNLRYLGVSWFAICPLWMNGWVRVNGPWVLAGCQAGRLGKMISSLSLWSSLSLAIIIIINITMNGGMSMNEWMNEWIKANAGADYWIAAQMAREGLTQHPLLQRGVFIVIKIGALSVHYKEKISYLVCWNSLLFSEWKWRGSLHKPLWLTKYFTFIPFIREEKKWELNTLE